MRNAAAVGIQPTQQQQQHQQHQHIMPPGHQTPVPLGGIQIHPGLQYGNHISGGGQRAGLGPGGDQIRDVWASNLDQEMAQVRNLITQYPYVSMVLKSQFGCCGGADVGVFRIRSFRGLWLDLLDSLKHRMSIIIRRCGVMSIYSR
jgi:hypothetical protein